MRKWLTIPVILFLVITIGVIGCLLIQASFDNSRLMLSELHAQIQAQVSKELSEQLGRAMQLNQINHDSLEMGILDLDSTVIRERYFVAHIKSYPNVAMTYIALPDGSFYGARRTADGEIQAVRNNAATGGDSWYYSISGTGEGVQFAERYPDFDPREHPWYSKAVDIGAPTLTDVYSHSTLHGPTITASSPFYDEDGRLVGVFGVDYILSWLGDTLHSLPIGTSGRVFMTDSEGKLIAASFDTALYRLVDGTSQLISVRESESPLIQAALAVPEAGGFDVLPHFTVDGEKYYVGVSHFQEYGVNWNIYVISAESDFLGGVRDATVQTGFILIGATAAAVFIAAWITGRLTRPIISLSRAAEALTRGDFVPIDDDGRKDELGVLKRSFNEMGRQLTDMVATLEKEVALRTQELKERNEELKRLSYQDGLTGIANRRRFDETMERAWNAALRHGRPMAVLMLDIDFFGDYNDAFGHQAGDECLRSVGNVLREKVRRASDLAARYGGEEFALILQDPERDKLYAYAESIRESIEALNIGREGLPCGVVTVSVGAAVMKPERDTTSSTLIERADKALYQAKQNGRNRVVVDDRGDMEHTQGREDTR